MPKLAFDGVAPATFFASTVSNAGKLATAAVILLAMSSPPAAWAAKDSRNTAKVRKLMFDYARCVVKSQRARASDAIVSNANNRTILDRYPKLISSECLGRTGGDVQMTFSGDLYRYALADALVNTDFATRGETSFADRLPLAHLPAPVSAELDAALAKTTSKRKQAELRENFGKQLGVSWLSRYGECVVRQAPVKARLWILTPPETAEETSRINDLRPAFAACMAEGTMKFSKATMRGTTAINYYRLAMATAQPVAERAR